MNPPISLQRYAWLSIGAALATIVLKTLAWWLTGSVGLLSDALESLVNLAGAIMALAMLGLAAQPEDENHTYGHGKAEYFSSGFEGMLILLASLAIAGTAVDRLLHPQALEQPGVGLVVSAVASVINFFTARVLLRAGKQYRSITLEADAHHLMTDVWTSVGVMVGVGLAVVTGWQWCDPLIAIGVAINILWTGWNLLRRSADGLMDIALAPEQQQAVIAVLEHYRPQGMDYHALRTRQSGTHSFIEVHVLVPGEWTVQRGHDLVENLETEIRQKLPGAQVLTHLEPLEDPASHSHLSTVSSEKS